MEDEKGIDHKLICVPVSSKIIDLEDLPSSFKEKCEYFFSHYKELEKNKWSKVSGFGKYSDAIKILHDSYQQYNRSQITTTSPSFFRNTVKMLIVKFLNFFF